MTFSAVPGGPYGHLTRRKTHLETSVKATCRAYSEDMTNTKKIRILLADDDPALGSALALLLETRLDASIVGESNNMENLLDDLKRYRPDIIILDRDLPGTPQKDRIAYLHKFYPALKVVIIGSQPEMAEQSLALDADAYISKSEPPEQMVEILQAIYM
jgi:DNA-binding NarL/FixJ family response regulator